MCARKNTVFITYNDLSTITKNVSMKYLEKNNIVISTVFGVDI